MDSYNCLSTTKAAESKDDLEFETVLFVPYTPNVALATALRAFVLWIGFYIYLTDTEISQLSLLPVWTGQQLLTATL